MKFGNKSSALIVLFFTILFFNSNLFAQNLKLLKEKSFNIQPGKILHVNFASGDIKVTSWDNNEVNVKIFGNSQAEKKVKFEISETEDGVVVKAKKESSFFIFNFFTSINMKAVIKVPENFKLDLISSGGDMEIKGIHGEAGIKTSGGDISISNCAADYNVRTSGGDVQIFNHNGNMNISTSGGDISVNNVTGFVKAFTSGGDINGKNINGNIIASTSGGDIYLQVKDGKVSAKSSGGDVSLYYSGINKGIGISTSGGDINLEVPQNIKADVLLKSSGGDITNNFPNKSVLTITPFKNESKFNGGGKKLICRTSGGDITLNVRK